MFSFKKRENMTKIKENHESFIIKNVFMSFESWKTDLRTDQCIDLVRQARGIYNKIL